jgi:hypothetical protein
MNQMRLLLWFLSFVDNDGYDFGWMDAATKRLLQDLSQELWF